MLPPGPAPNVVDEVGHVTLGDIIALPARQPADTIALPARRGMFKIPFADLVTGQVVLGEDSGRVYSIRRAQLPQGTRREQQPMRYGLAFEREVVHVEACRGQATACGAKTPLDLYTAST